jgi:hypothetical protein
MGALAGVAMVAMLVIVGVAATAIVLLRNATIERDRLLEVAERVRPDPPTVAVRSPVFVATASGRRYHLGCTVGDEDGEVRYAIWTTRSHRVVAVFDPTDEGWTAAWDLYLRVEHDTSPAWVDHRGARRSRREWTGRRSGPVLTAASSQPRSGGPGP